MKQKQNKKMSRCQAPSPNSGIYLHIPFCRKKCAYCSFISQKHDERIEERYFDVLCAEIREREPLFERVGTIYLGGGTPSIVSLKSIEKTVYELKNRYDALGIKEFTIELNPESVTKERILFYKSLGIDRFSLGVQSIDDNVLRVLDRPHRRREVEEALGIFDEDDNLTIDLIWGVTGHRQNISFVDDYPIKHISTYMLTVEEKTPLFTKGYRVKNDAAIEKEYFMLLEELYKRNFERYEVSNFAKKSYKSVHNSAYWDVDSVYTGYGVSAASYDGKSRSQNTDSIEDYIESGGKLECVESIDDGRRIFEKIMLSMRTVNGIKLNQEIERHLNELKTLEYVKTGKLKLYDGNLSFTDAGFLIMNYILTDIEI
ncbi:MAG: radical SAM family heme chaperone HemW [bacterium]